MFFSIIFSLSIQQVTFRHGLHGPHVVFHCFLSPAQVLIHTAPPLFPLRRVNLDHQGITSTQNREINSLLDTLNRH